MIWTSINKVIRGKKCSRDDHHVFPNKYIQLQICLVRFGELGTASGCDIGFIIRIYWGEKPYRNKKML